MAIEKQTTTNNTKKIKVVKDINKIQREKVINAGKSNVLISVKNITKTFGGDIILKGLTFDILENQFVTFLGYSGCGKSTTLRILSGLETPTSGEIVFDQKDLLKIPINKRPFNTVFQSYALFPHMNVFENVAYGLRIKKVEKSEIEKQVTDILKKVGLAGYEDRDVRYLSGGQKQRVAIARALVNKPRVLLLDEPLGALDVKIKREMQQEIKKLQVEFGITFVYVTHDQEEAMMLSDKIIIMNNGLIEQMGRPEEIYNSPENKWVANFIGQANILEDAIFVKDLKVNLGKKDFRCTSIGFGTNEKVDVVIRPEDIEITKPGKGFFNGEIKQIEFKGINFEITADINYAGNKKQFTIQTTKQHQVGDDIDIKWDDDAIHVMWKEPEAYAN